MRISLRNPTVGLLALALMVCHLAMPATSSGCDTPVYRFAMYSQRWDPYPYPVFYLYDGKQAAEDEQVNARLAELSQRDSHTNVALQAIDVSDKDLYTQLPAPVREQWENRKQKSQPLHLVFTPRRALLFAGRLQVEDVEGLIDSPVRQQVATALGTGSLVFVLLEGTDEDTNDAAAKEVEEVVRRARDGEIQAPGPKALLPGPQPGAGDAGADDSLAVNVKLIRIAADDAKEAWLVKMLMWVESDLKDFAGEPMVFGVYGRGRALEPFIGRGISADNLVTENVLYMCGPCSCEIKEQNPGVDLLTTTDWEKQALTMARIFGEEEGNERLLGAGELVPSLVSDPEDDAVNRAADGADPGATAVAGSQGTDDTDGTKPPVASEAQPDDDTPAPPANATPTAAPSRPAGEAFGGRLATMLFVGVAIVLAVLAGGSALVLRGR